MTRHPVQVFQISHVFREPHLQPHLKFISQPLAFLIPRNTGGVTVGDLPFLPELESNIASFELTYGNIGPRSWLLTWAVPFMIWTPERGFLCQFRRKLSWSYFFSASRSGNRVGHFLFEIRKEEEVTRSIDWAAGSMRQPLGFHSLMNVLRRSGIVGKGIVNMDHVPFQGLPTSMRSNVGR
jgi:hypothetical protein